MTAVKLQGLTSRREHLINLIFLQLIQYDLLLQVLPLVISNYIDNEFSYTADQLVHCVYTTDKQFVPCIT